MSGRDGKQGIAPARLKMKTLNDNPYNTDSNKDDENTAGYVFTKAYVIPGSEEQDKKASETFIEHSSKEYRVLSENCAMAVSESLVAASLISPLKQTNLKDRIH